MPWISFKIYSLLITEILQGNVVNINTPLTQKTDYWWNKLPQDDSTTVMLI